MYFENFMVLVRINKWTLLSTIVILTICFGSVEYFDNIRLSHEVLDGAILLFWTLIVIPVTLGYTVIEAIRRSIKDTSKTYQLGTIGLSYLCLILCFTGIYYIQTAMGDYNETVSEKNYYEMFTTVTFMQDHLQDGYDIKRAETYRAFRGMTNRMWGGLRDKVVGWSRASGEPPVEMLIKASRWSVEDIAFLKKENRLPVIVDCFYFSVITMATLGYGDITPVSMLAKLTVSVQVLVGVFLTVVAIGLAIQNLGNESNEILK